MLTLYFTIFGLVVLAGAIIVGAFFGIAALIDHAPNVMRWVGYVLVGLVIAAYVALIIFTAVV